MLSKQKSYRHIKILGYIVTALNVLAYVCYWEIGLQRPENYVCWFAANCTSIGNKAGIQNHFNFIVPL